MFHRRVSPWLALLVLSCGKKAPETAASSNPYLQSLQAAIDPSVDPCTDFYTYACGTWLKNTEIPADRSYWGRSFSTITERNEVLLREILDAAAKDPAGNPALAKVGTFYATCMDEAAVEARGVTPLQPWLAKIDAVKTPADAARVVGELQMIGLAPLFDMGPYPDFKDPNLTILHMSQGGLGLPDRDYYLTDETASIREQYLAHVAAMFVLLGTPEADAKTQAQQVLAFETELAKVQIPREELRDPDKTYHRLERDGLKAAAPDFNWDAMFAGMGYDALKEINVEVPDVYKAMGALVQKTDPAVLRAYLRYQLVTSAAPTLSKALVEQNFAFYGRTLYGQPEMRPRWKRCLQTTQDAMGELLGQVYVERAFSGPSKPIAVDMIKGIEGAFEAGLPQLAWMDDTTRARAVEKARAVTNKIGYPDKWRDYSGLAVTEGTYFENLTAARAFSGRYYLDKVGKPVDRSEWMMNPQDVNAYYNPLNNEIVFPAGILQPPFFSADAPMAMNLGGIGMVMGHELTHGFDDEGRKFAPDGRLTVWWDEAASQRYEEAAACVVEQSNAYEGQPGLHVNGELTTGENIADIGGVRLAYRAYQDWASKQAKKPEGLGDYSDEQLVFLSFAQGWCTLARPEAERVRVATDPHSPAKFRVNGALTNLPEFHEAFDCKVGTPMHPEKTCTVW